MKWQMRFGAIGCFISLLHPRHTQQRRPASAQDLQSCEIHFSHTEMCRLKALGCVLGQEGGEEMAHTFKSPSSVCVCVCVCVCGSFHRVRLHVECWHHSSYSLSNSQGFTNNTHGESQARHKSGDVFFPTFFQNKTQNWLWRKTRAWNLN